MCDATPNLPDSVDFPLVCGKGFIEQIQDREEFEYTMYMTEEEIEEMFWLLNNEPVEEHEWVEI